MTKSQLKAELRRSALEDFYPYWDVDAFAWCFANKNFGPIGLGQSDAVRTFFLLVAEAL